MEKPISLQIEEFKGNIAEVINNSGLPIVVVEPVFRDFCTELRALREAQLQKDIAQYKQSLSDESENEEGNEGEAEG